MIKQKTIVPATIAVAIVGFAICFSLLMRIPSNLGTLVLLIIMLNCAVDCALFLLFCVRGLAGVYKQSRVISRKIRSYLLRITVNKKGNGPKDF